MSQIRETLRQVANQVRQFNNDEDGIESIQVVMILALGAVVMVAAWAFWDQISTWASGKITSLIGK